MALPDDDLLRQWATRYGGTPPDTGGAGGYQPVTDVASPYAPLDAPLPGEAQAAYEAARDPEFQFLQKPLKPAQVQVSGGEPSIREGTGVVQPGTGKVVAPTPAGEAPPAPPEPPPVRQGQTVPMGMIDDDGNLVDVRAGMPERKPVAGGGGYKPPLKLFHGGFMYPRSLDEAKSEIETARLQERISDDEAARALQELPQKFADWQESTVGMQVELGRTDIDASEAHAAIDAQGLEGRAAHSQAVGERYGQLQEDLRERQIEEERQARSRALALRHQEQQYKQAVQEMRDYRIDPQRYQSKQSGWDKAVTAMAMILGGIGGGNSNAFLEMFKMNVENEINAQKDELAAKKDFAIGQQNVLGMMRQRFEDEQVAEAAARKFMIDELKFDLKKMGSKLQSEEHLLLRDQMLGDLEAQSKIQEQKMAIEAQKLADMEELRRRHAAQQKAQAASGVRVVKGGKDWEKRYVPGVGVVSTKEDALRLRKALPKFDTVEEALVELKALAEEYNAASYVGGALGVSEVENRYKALARRVNANLSQMEEQGVITDTERETISEQIPETPNVFFKGATNATIDATTGYAKELKKKTLERQQVIPVAPVGYDEKGNPIWGQ